MTLNALGRQLFPCHGGTHPRADGPAGHFLVTSSGHSGSIWFAGSLNLHDEVCATVGLGHPLQCFSRYALNKDVKDMTARASPELIAYGFHAPTGHLPPLPAAEISRNRDTWRLPWYIFDELALVPGPRQYKCLGNVHGIDIAHLYRAWEADPEAFHGPDAVIVDLLRHPVPRTESAINATMTFHLPDWEPAISDFMHAHARECLDLEREYKIDLSEPRARAVFIVYRVSRQNDEWAAQLQTYPQIHRILLERLQTDPDYYASVFYTLTQGHLMADPPYLDRVFAAENLGSGRQSTAANARPPGATAQYGLWSRWEQEEFARVTGRLNLPRLYFRFGYDFSFVTKSHGDNTSWFVDMLS